MELVIPSSRFKDSFISAVREFQSTKNYNETEKSYRDLPISELEEDFETYVQKEVSRSRGENLPEGYVPDTTLWLIDKEEYVGRVSIRHQLTEHLLNIGGHVGYDIRPSKRGQGYGSKILELVLPKVRSLGIKNILLTCDETNHASRKIIEKNGGVLENSVLNPETGIQKLRFWIRTK